MDSCRMLESLIAEAFNVTDVGELKKVLNDHGPDSEALRAAFGVDRSAMEGTKCSSRNGRDDDTSLEELQKMNDRLDRALSGGEDIQSAANLCEGSVAAPSPPSKGVDATQYGRRAKGPIASTQSFISRPPAPQGAMSKRSFRWVCDICGTENAIPDIVQRRFLGRKQCRPPDVNNDVVSCRECSFRPKTV